jgi:HlyD family type I secretion membrane fusion protein
MEIVPAEDALIVEVQVSPADIDTVRIGLAVRLTFSAFNHWSTPVIDGTVVDVSGDRLTDQRTGANYYTARISADPEQLAQHKLELRPGMPVDAQIVTGQRTLMEYLLRPVTDLMRRSLREE